MDPLPDGAARPDGALPLPLLDALAQPLPLPGAPAGADAHALALAALAAPGAPAPLLTLAVYPDGQFVVTYDDHGVTYRKSVDSGAMRRAALALSFDSGWQLTTARPVRWGEQERGAFVVLWLPPGVQSLLLTDDAGASVRLAVPLPGLVFAGRGPHYRAWALDTPEFSPGATACHAPLPNVMGDAAICWGANRPPAAAPDTAPAALHLFLHEAAFNNHAVAGKSRAAPRDVRPQLCALAAAGAPVYPTADLVPFAARGDEPLPIGALVERTLQIGGRS